jgi:hypothetical protein
MAKKMFASQKVEEKWKGPPTLRRLEDGENDLRDLKWSDEGKGQIAQITL